MKELSSKISEVEKKLEYIFSRKELLLQAFIHSSYYNENKKEAKQHNERLEFLGDTVLGLVCAEYLFQEMPEEKEGELSIFLSMLVNAESCMEYLINLELQGYILLGKGQKKRGGKGKQTIMSDAFEAIIGAMYLDGGFEKVKDFFRRKLSPLIVQKIQEPSKNYKASLQDFSQKNFSVKPVYKVLSEEGPFHELTFHVGVYIQDKEVGTGSGSSKKEAEQVAAKIALKRLENK